MPIINELEFDPTKPDASFDLDGTKFKFTVLEEFTEWMCTQGIFRPMPAEITEAKQVWKAVNTEENYKTHLGLLVRFFIGEIPGKSVDTMREAATIVAGLQAKRRWNITSALMEHLKPTHNVIANSLMPEWLMVPFTRGLGLTALIGSIYVEKDGKFTGEAYSIDKAEEYTKFRGAENVGMLDIAMGDTTGDASLFRLAQRPILFNPSWTLQSVPDLQQATSITSYKDVVSVENQGPDGPLPLVKFGAPFDVAAILAEVRDLRAA